MATCLLVSHFLSASPAPHLDTIVAQVAAETARVVFALSGAVRPQP